MLWREIEEVWWRCAGGRLNRADEAGGEGEEGADKLEDASHYDAHQAEGEKQQPDEGVEDEREQGCGPADEEEDQEEEKLHGVGLPFFGLYAGAVRVVPWINYRVAAIRSRTVAIFPDSISETSTPYTRYSLDSSEQFVNVQVHFKIPKAGFIRNESSFKLEDTADEIVQQRRMSVDPILWGKLDHSRRFFGGIHLSILPVAGG
jgi:hypothetical protein